MTPLDVAWAAPGVRGVRRVRRLQILPRIAAESVQAPLATKNVVIAFEGGTQRCVRPDHHPAHRILLLSRAPG